MTLEEAIQWCSKEEVFVKFYTLDSQIEVIIYEDGYDLEMLGRGNTLIEAVQDVMKQRQEA
jgi:hypothetical protein